MCGIAAILLSPRERPAEHWQGIRRIFSQNLISNEQRGRAATGVAVADANGNVRIHKSPLAASKFVMTGEYRAVLRCIGSRTTLILGHTRLATKGDPGQNRNNHPIQIGDVFGIHNGEVTNDDELFDRCGYERTTEVDSEIIFQLIEGIDPGLSGDRYLEEARRRIRTLEGQYTFLASDRRKPDQLLLLRHLAPLSIHFHPEWSALIFSSRYIFLRKAFGTAQIDEPLEHNRLMLFDATRIAELGSTPKKTIALYA